MNWILWPDNYVPDEPEWVQLLEQAIKGCPGHLWQLVLEDNGEVHLSCELCPAGTDDLYPDGCDLMYYSAGGVEVEAGSHNLPDSDTPVWIPVTAHIVTSRNYWGEYDVEMFIDPRSLDETPSSVGDGS